MRSFSRPAGACRWLALALLAASGTATADELDSAPAVSFAALWQQALDASPELAAVAAERAMAAGDQLQAGLRPNPQLQVTTENLGVAGREDTLAVAQTIELGDKRAARMALAGRQSALAGGLVAHKRAELHADLRQAFQELLAAQARRALAEDALALMQQAVNSVGKRIAAGRLAAVAATRADIELVQARLQAERTRTDLARAGRRLGALAGDARRTIRAAGALAAPPTLPPLPALHAALVAAPALAAANLETARRAAQVRLAQTERFGDLTVSAGLRYMNELREPAGVLSVAIPLPFSNRNQGNLAHAQSATEQAAALERATEVQLARDLDDAYLRLEMALRAATQIEHSVQPAAQATLDATRRGFELGKFGLTELIDARRVLLQARTQLIDARLDAQLAFTDITRVLGDERIAGTP